MRSTPSPAPRRSSAAFRRAASRLRAPSSQHYRPRRRRSRPSWPAGARRRAGFTLLEMLVVIVLAGILLSLVSINITPDPRFLYLNDCYQEALAANPALAQKIVDAIMAKRAAAAEPASRPESSGRSSRPTSRGRSTCWPTATTPTSPLSSTSPTAPSSASASARASTKALNSGCPARGVEVNSGWNCTPKKNGCPGSSIISGRFSLGVRAERGHGDAERGAHRFAADDDDRGTEFTDDRGRDLHQHLVWQLEISRLDPRQVWIGEGIVDAGAQIGAGDALAGRLDDCANDSLERNRQAAGDIARVAA